MSSHINIEPGPLSFYRPIWNEKTGSFGTNSIQTVSNCMEAGKPGVEFCFKTCQEQFGVDGKEPSYAKHKKCHTQCKELVNVREITCMEYPSKTKEYIHHCSHEFGCGKYPLYNKPCVEKNKQKILSCCKSKCGLSFLGDCEERCQGQYDHILSGGKSVLMDLADSYELDKEKYQDKPEYTLVYIFSVVWLFLLFYAVMLLRK